ncbi:MAG: folate-binding protein [Pseudomonadales bacterium]|nr:folate-binding protein [Pseudomonadales bacterium]
MTDKTPAQADQSLPTPAFAVVSDHLVARVSGPDARSFLNGQLSQSLDDVTAVHSPRAAASTHKGRAYALSRLVSDGDDILLSLQRDCADDVIKARLGRFLMLYRGTEMVEAENITVLGLLGAEWAQWLAPEANLQAVGDTVQIHGHHLIRTEDTAEGLVRFEFWQQGPLTGELAHPFSDDRLTTLTNWQASEIAAGVPALTPDSQEQYVAQMLNWQHLNGIHFKKGCYTGQEVIARMHFLGQLKKSLFRLKASAGGATPVTGTPILAGDKAVGEVVNAVGFSDGSAELLAVLRHDASQGSLQLATNGQELTVMPLPYAVPERESDT